MEEAKDNLCIATLFNLKEENVKRAARVEKLQIKEN
jgi:hypothetical protein